ncbi:uncharacterized protein PpBr36_06292 [Pyricularia pennisetigena]|uniref:uncharacterized protein n=1 Tax=Pyricularia pennisetigena TaxID=1578925 RepID=UPI001152DB85|nr:uncharacterized protein PpBr36_06292 [Pyricularia pennisetigena]TLS23370.1 hypothetical protein PpBr36_06292 [Pyricularia pennisetigena]
MGTSKKTPEMSRRRPKQSKVTSDDFLNSQAQGVKASVSSAAAPRVPTTPKKGKKETARTRQVLDSPPLSSSPSPELPQQEQEYEKWNYTPIPPHGAQKSANGRNEGRSLIMWGRPRMIEKVMMHLQYECSRHKIELPWDAIAHRLHPGSTGGAVVQHLGRLRSQLIVEGHLVPPPMQKPGSRAQVDPWIRGYVRKDQDAKVCFKTGNEAFETRAVRFDEKLDDRHFNIPDAVDVINNQSVSSPAKSKNKNGKRSAARTLSSPSKRIKREIAEVDPAHLPMDADYNPITQAVPRRKAAARAALAIANNGPDSELDDIEDGDGYLAAAQEEVPHELSEHLKNIEVPLGIGEQEHMENHLTEQEDGYADRIRGVVDPEYNEEASRRLSETVISPEFSQPLPYEGYEGLTVDFGDDDEEEEEDEDDEDDDDVVNIKDRVNASDEN